VAGEVVDFFCVGSDFTISAGGQTLAGDIKLPRDNFCPGQMEVFDATNIGEKVPAPGAKS
jgi:hypothetical protein